MEILTSVLAPLVNLFRDVMNWFTKDRRKLLPYSEVVIGTYSTDDLKVGIRTAITLSEQVRPHVDQFLTRVEIGDPYCAHCSRTLDILRATYMGDFAQIGYSCPVCKTEIRKNAADLFKDVTAEVRRNYDAYWNKYHQEISSLTNGKPHKFRLP